MTRVLMILTNGFNPDVRVYKEAKYLAENGCFVQIFAWDREKEHFLHQEEILDGVHIFRSFVQAKYGTGIKQLFPFIKFKKQVNSYIRHHDFDYIHCHDLDACLFTASKKGKLIFDMHEFYYSRRPIFNYLIQKLTLHYQKKSTHIIYVNSFQIHRLPERLKPKCLFLPNYPDPSSVYLIPKSGSEVFRICYFGSVRQFNELKILCDCAKKDDRLLVHIEGTGVASDDIRRYSKNIPNVLIGGGYDGSKDSSVLYSRADLIYCIYPESNINLAHALPVKFFESVATGTPVIANKNSAMLEIIEKEKIGYIVERNDFQTIFAMIESIINNRNEYEQIRQNVANLSSSYSWKSVCNVLNFYFEEKKR